MTTKEYIALFNKKYKAIERMDALHNPSPHSSHATNRAIQQAHSVPRTITVVQIYTDAFDEH